MKNNWLHIIIVILLISGCDSKEAFDCVKTPGEMQTLAITEFPEFRELLIHDNIELEIIDDETEYFEILYGENLIPKIKVVSENDSILFLNENFCNWTRDFKKPLIKWHTNKDNVLIRSMSSGNIFNKDTLRMDIQIQSENYSNNIDLVVNNNRTILSTNSISNFTLKGQSNGLFVRSYFSDSRFNLSNLKVNRADILQRGYNDIIVNPTDSLVGSIENAGRILYYGNPGIKVEVRNGGELIPLE